MPDGTSTKKSFSEQLLGYLNLITTIIATIVLAIIFNGNNLNLQRELADRDATQAVEIAKLQNELSREANYAHLNLTVLGCDETNTCFGPVAVDNRGPATATNVRIRLQYFVDTNSISSEFNTNISDISEFQFSVQPTIFEPSIRYSRVSPASITSNNVIEFTLQHLSPGQTIRVGPNMGRLGSVFIQQRLTQPYLIEFEPPTPSLQEIDTVLASELRTILTIGYFDSSAVCDNCEGDVASSWMTLSPLITLQTVSMYETVTKTQTPAVSGEVDFVIAVPPNVVVPTQQSLDIPVERFLAATLRSVQDVYAATTAP